MAKRKKIFRRKKNAFLIFAKLFGMGFLISVIYVFWLPDVVPLRKQNPTVTSYMLIKEKRTAAKGGKLHRKIAWTGWDKISEHLKHAVMIAEDDNFYRHNGVDWGNTWRAVKKDWSKKRLAYGGSTITQQVARNLYLSPAKNPLRKIKEILIARKLEKALGKRRIFEIYLNIAEWGKGIYGAQAASTAYFGKDVSELDPEEAAALAAVLPNPGRFSPVKESRYVKKHKQSILARMKASGYLPEEMDEKEFEDSFEVLASTRSG